MTAIPRFLHQTWKSPQLPDEWKAYQESWLRHHPDWSYVLWTDADYLPFVQAHFPEFEQTFAAYSYQIQRVDAIRYLILLQQGGVYVDLDIECLRPIDALIANRTFAIAREPAIHAEWAGVGDLLCNAFMASVPGHPFLTAVVAELQRTAPAIVIHTEVLTSTGPAMMARVERAVPLDKGSILDTRVAYPFASNSAEMAGLRDGSPRAAAIKAAAAEAGAFAIHYWANTWVRSLAGALDNPAPWAVSGYRFFPGKDSNGHDIGNVGRTVATLAARCDSDPRAVAFNTDGFIKNAVRPVEEWNDVPNPDGNEGLYMKTSLSG